MNIFHTLIRVFCGEDVHFDDGASKFILYFVIIRTVGHVQTV